MKRRRVLTGTVGVLVLSVGLVLANYGGSVTPAAAAPMAKDDPHAGLTQNWDQNLPSASRFTTVFTGAVRDNNTGLVWEQAPDDTLRLWQSVFFPPWAATDYCVNKEVGGTAGWRLPSVVELMSVQDPRLPAPYVPASAFTLSTSDNTPGVKLGSYWSATMMAFDPNRVWVVIFGETFGAPRAIHGSRTGDSYVWCVRGPMSESVY